MGRDGKGVSQYKQLRAYADGLASPGAAVAPPAALLELAEQVLRGLRAPAYLTADDLVSELTVRLLERARAGKDPIGPARNLRTVLRHRLRQLAIDHAPSRKVLKELTDHVRRALEEPWGQPTPSRPLFLERDGRFVHAQVRSAIAWARTREDLPVDPAALARWLAREFDLLVEVGSGPTELDAWGSTTPPIDGVVLAWTLRERLGDQVLKVLLMRLSGAPLREIAEYLGCATATAHAHVSRATDILSEELRNAGACPNEAVAALELLAQAFVLARPAAKRDSREPEATAWL
jgi:DNA-directed RNA polymerase specialized sigma24 family protein